jgi:hypothetical protein
LTETLQKLTPLCKIDKSFANLHPISQFGDIFNIFF